MHLVTFDQKESFCSLKVVSKCDQSTYNKSTLVFVRVLLGAEIYRYFMKEMHKSFNKSEPIHLLTSQIKAERYTDQYNNEGKHTLQMNCEAFHSPSAIRVHAECTPPPIIKSAASISLKMINSRFLLH
jgi:hypothetical protein